MTVVCTSAIDRREAPRCAALAWRRRVGGYEAQQSADTVGCSADRPERAVDKEPMAGNPGIDTGTLGATTRLALPRKSLTLLSLLYPSSFRHGGLISPSNRTISRPRY